MTEWMKDTNPQRKQGPALNMPCLRRGLGGFWSEVDWCASFPGAMNYAAYVDREPSSATRCG